MSAWTSATNCLPAAAGRWLSRPRWGSATVRHTVFSVWTVPACASPPTACTPACAPPPASSAQSTVESASADRRLGDRPHGISLVDVAGARFCGLLILSGGPRRKFPVSARNLRQPGQRVRPGQRVDPTTVHRGLVILIVVASEHERTTEGEVIVSSTSNNVPSGDTSRGASTAAPMCTPAPDPARSAPSVSRSLQGDQPDSPNAAAAIRLYVAGAPVRKIFDECGIACNELYRLLKQAGVPHRRRFASRFTDLERIAAAIEAQNQRDRYGMSITKIAAQTGRARWTIRDLLRLDLSQYSEAQRAEALRHHPDPFPPLWASPEELSAWAAVAGIEHATSPDTPAYGRGRSQQAVAERAAQAPALSAESDCWQTPTRPRQATS